MTLGNWSNFYMAARLLNQYGMGLQIEAKWMLLCSHAGQGIHANPDINYDENLLLSYSLRVITTIAGASYTSRIGKFT
jgi:hypothetical protein